MRVDGLVPRSALCGVALAASTAAACCFVAVWSYWYHELDAECADGRDCKCVLFGTSLGGGAFLGGDRFACRYAFGSAAASAGLAACACSYYGVRALLCRVPRRRPSPSSPPSPPQEQLRPLHRDGQPPRQKRVHRRPETPQTRTTSDERRPPDARTCSQITGSKICSIILFAAMTLNMFVASVVLSNGYISTCQQYVHRVKSFLMVSGKMVELVSERMSCATIYDFLDYLQPPSRQVTYELIHRHKPNPRDHIINTAALLITSIAMSWLSTFLWLMYTIHIYYFQ